MTCNINYKSKAFGFLSDQIPEDVSSRYYQTKARFQQCKSYIRLRFEESIRDIEGLPIHRKTAASASPKSSIKKYKDDKKPTNIEKEIPKNKYFIQKHRRLKLAHIIKDQAKDILALRCNNKINIKHIINKSAETRQKIIDSNDDVELEFYNPIENKTCMTPEVLPFKFFRQKRFLKISKQAISKLKEKLSFTQDKIQQTKKNFLDFDDTSQNKIPFLMKTRNRKNHSFLRISKSHSPLNQIQRRSPKIQSPISLSPLFRNGDKCDEDKQQNNAHFMVNQIKDRLNVRRASIEISRRNKRDGFLQEQISRHKINNDSLRNNPFQAMMWDRIMTIRPKKDEIDRGLENKLLRIAFDRKNKLTHLNQVLGYDKRKGHCKINAKMSDLYKKDIKENARQHDIYSELLLGLYEKKDELSENEIKFTDLIKKIIEKGLVITVEVMNNLISNNFSKEELKNKDFKEILMAFKINLNN